MKFFGIGSSYGRNGKILLFCLLAVTSTLSQITTKGTFYSGTYSSGAVEEKGDVDFYTTAEHHECTSEDQCNFVVDQLGNGKQMAKANEESDLENIEPRAIVWEKENVEGFKDCKEAYEFGMREDGEIEISWRNGTNFLASCDMKTDGGGWTVFQRRTSNVPSFQKNWAACKHGFGDILESHWLGLAALSILTSKGNVTLRVDLKNNTQASGYAKYTDFKVSDEVSKYQLQLGYYRGNIGDAMRVNNGMYFSTFDKDNDNDISVNYATFTGGPWWHSSDYKTNLNNQYSASPSMPLVGMSWKTWNDKFADISFSEMKLRRED